MSQCLTFTDRRQRDETPGRVEQALNSVSFYHVGVLGIVFVWGVLANWVAAPDVQAVLTPLVYTVWTVLHMLAPPVVWAGKIVVAKAENTESPRWQLTGWQMQNGGDLAICILCTTTIFAFAAAGNTFVLLVTFGMAGCAAGLAGRDFIKTRHQRDAVNSAGSSGG